MTIRAPHRSALLAAGLLLAASAQALTPAEVFEKVSPSVWAVRPLDASGRPINYGSGVVVGPARVVTNCHVLVRGKAVQVRRESDKAQFEATLEHADPERDLCLLSVKGLVAPAVQIAPLASARVGQRAYTIGNPEGLSLTLAEGLISGLRPEDPRLPPIQTSAPISPGSSGGGLFDELGRLVGITTAAVPGRRRLAQNLNFAMPAEWIAEVPERAAALLAKRKEQAAPVGKAASATLPASGSRYRYEWVDLKFGKRQEFSVQIADVNGWDVKETLASGDSSRDISVNARAMRFHPRLLGGGQALLEFAPYLAEGNNAVDEIAGGGAAGYPGAADASWKISVRSQDWEQVSVPAGSFKALRVEIAGSREQLARLGATSIIVQRFEFTGWYAPEAKRYVKLRHKTWNPSQQPLSDDQVELLERKSP
jgi:S1-C subfamily serine protease